MISPQELKRREFAKSFMGYSANDVDDYISFLFSRYNELYLAYCELERKYNASLVELENAKSEENTVTTTIVNAQKMADAIVTEAKKKASEIKGAVSGSCDRILDAYRTKVTIERDKLVECESAVTRFKNALYEAYKKHIAIIDEIMPDEEPTNYLNDDELEQKAIELASDKLRKTEEEVVSKQDESAENEVISSSETDL